MDYGSESRWTIACPRLPDSREREKNAYEKGVGAWVEQAVVFVFSTIWEPGTGYVNKDSDAFVLIGCFHSE